MTNLLVPFFSTDFHCRRLAISQKVSTLQAVEEAFFSSCYVRFLFKLLKMHHQVRVAPLFDFRDDAPFP